MPGRKIDVGHISALFGIVAALGGVAGFFFSPDSQRCIGLRGDYRGHPLRALRHCTDDGGRELAQAPLEPHGGAALKPADPPPAVASAAPTSGAAQPPSSAPPRDPSPEPAATSAGRFAGTRWVFYDGDKKTFADFAPDGTVTFSDPAYGLDGTWSLVGKRDLAFHTDAFAFTGTPGRDVPDTFAVTFRHLPRGSTQPEEAHTVTFVRVP